MSVLNIGHQLVIAHWCRSNMRGWLYSAIKSSAGALTVISRCVICATVYFRVMWMSEYLTLSNGANGRGCWIAITFRLLCTKRRSVGVSTSLMMVFVGQIVLMFLDIKDVRTEIRGGTLATVPK